jgi:hypothetical protein
MVPFITGVVQLAQRDLDLPATRCRGSGAAHGVPFGDLAAGDVVADILGALMNVDRYGAPSSSSSVVLTIVVLSATTWPSLPEVMPLAGLAPSW